MRKITYNWRSGLTAQNYINFRVTGDMASAATLLN